MPERARGEHRRTPAENLEWMRARFGIGDPPKVSPVVQTLADTLPEDPYADLEATRAAIAAAEANGLRLTTATKVTRPPSP